MLHLWHLMIGLSSLGVPVYIEARCINSRVSIGAHTQINNGASIISSGACITIGARCLIGLHFQCYDSDFHSLHPEHRNEATWIKTADVVIGDNVFIGNNVIVLKGVKLGDACSVGAGSVVTKSFPPHSVIAGNPATLIKSYNSTDV